MVEVEVLMYFPRAEFLEALRNIRNYFLVVFVISIIIAIIVSRIFSKKITKPLSHISGRMRDISHGDGDLTARLPVNGNDEIAQLSEYVNETIKKTGLTIKSVLNISSELNKTGQDLSSNMIETAGAIHQISANIEGIKQQSINQASSFNKTSATM